MPVIREYGDQRVSAPGPIQQREYTPDQFGAAEGRALTQLGGAVQDAAETVAKRIDQENTSDITAKVTQAQAALAIKQQQIFRTAEPGNKKVFEDFDKEVEDTLSKVGENASTIGARTFFNEAAVRIKGSFATSSANAQADLAGVKAVQDYTKTANSLQTAAKVNPTSVGLQLQMHKAAIENLVVNGQLPRAKAIELETRGNSELAQAAIQGWAELDADYAKKKLSSGEFDEFFSADQRAQLMGQIEQARRAKEIDAERQERLAEKTLKKAQTKTQNDFLQAMHEGKLTAKDILNSNLDPTGGGSKDQFLGMLKKMNDPEEKLKTDSNTMISLYNRIHLPDGDPNKIVDENELNGYFGRGLSFADLGRLREEMQGKGTEAGRVEADLKKQVLDIARGKLTRSNPLTGLRDPVGDEQMQKFMVYFFDEYRERRQKGDTALELLSPDSPKYLGKNINQYVRTQQQVMRDLVPRRAKPENTLSSNPLAPTSESAGAAQPPARYEAPKKPVLPRQPGESAADYLKRKKAAGG